MQTITDIIKWQQLSFEKKVWQNYICDKIVYFNPFPNWKRLKQFQVEEIGRKFQNRGEHIEKKINCSLWAIFPFSTVFSKGL